jgi:hypothetical protein
MPETDDDIHAYDRRDALSQIQRRLERLIRVSYPFRDFLPRDTPLAALLDSTPGLLVLAGSMATYFEHTLNTRKFGLARKLFVDPLLPQGMLPVVRNPNNVGLSIALDTGAIQAHRGTVIPGEFRLAEIVHIARTAEPNDLDRAVDTVLVNYGRREDSATRSLLDAAADTNESLSYRTFDSDVFDKLISKVERRARVVARAIVFSRSMISDIVRTMSHLVEPETQREALLAGFIGTYRNAQLICAASGLEEVVAPGTAYVVPSPEYFGALSVREPFTTTAAPKLTEVVFHTHETISMMVPVTARVGRLRKET